MTKPKGTLLVSIVNLAGGGAERVVSNLTRSLDGWDCHLLLFEEDVGYPYDGRLHTLDIELHTGSRPHKATELARAGTRMARVKRQVAPDVSLSFLFWPNVLNIVTRNGERVVASVRNSRSDALLDGNGIVRSNFYRMLTHRAYNEADGIIAISDGVAGDLTNNFGISPELLRTIYNPIAVDEVHEQAGEPLAGPFRELFDSPTIVSVGRFVEQKGHWHLIRAFRHVGERLDEEVRLVLLGKGPLEDYLLGLAEDLGLPTWHWRRDRGEALDDARVVFAGFRDNPHQFTAQASLFAFPSLSEGLGNVLLESLACGTAIVASDCDFGPREILAPSTDPHLRTRRRTYAEYGVLMPAPDGRRHSSDDPLTGVEREWAETMGELLEDEERRTSIAEKGPERVEDFRSLEIVDQWEEALA